MSDRHILVPVDDSETTQRALAHVVAHFAGTSAKCRVFHIVGPVPPALLEFGGASDPEEEQRIEREMTEAEAKWLAAEQEKVRPMLERAKATLLAGGFEESRVSVHVGDSMPEDRLGRVIVDEARDAGCDTIVVGHTAYSWLKEKFHRHVSDDLKKHAKGIEIVVIEA